LCFDGSPVDEDSRIAYNARQWETDMCHAPCNDPLGCCAALFCACPCSMYLRYKSLNEDMTRYTCCQGYFCPSCMSNTEDCARSCPWPCLCLEAFFCASCAISATRMYVQDERQIVTDPCDNRIIRLNNCLQILSCVCSILAVFIAGLDNLAELIRCVAHIVYLVTQACMQAQVHRELERHPTADDYNISTEPRMIPADPYAPPATGYVPPQPQYGYTPQSAYPGQGYPPQGYAAPPAAYPPQGGYAPQQSGYPQQGGYAPQQQQQQYSGQQGYGYRPL